MHLWFSFSPFLSPLSSILSPLSQLSPRNPSPPLFFDLHLLSLSNSSLSFSRTHIATSKPPSESHAPHLLRHLCPPTTLKLHLHHPRQPNRTVKTRGWADLKWYKSKDCGARRRYLGLVLSFLGFNLWVFVSFNSNIRNFGGLFLLRFRMIGLFSVFKFL